MINYMAKARKAIESLYKGLCTIWEYDDVEDEVTGETTTELVPVYEDIPCRVSKKTIGSAIGSNDVNNAIKYETVLFINPNTIIKPGSQIEVTQNGVTVKYKRSGEPFHYTNHQEIILQKVDVS